MYRTSGVEFIPFGMVRNEDGSYYFSHVTMMNSTMENHLDKTMEDLISDAEESELIRDLLMNPFKHLSDKYLSNVSFAINLKTIKYPPEAGDEKVHTYCIDPRDGYFDEETKFFTNTFIIDRDTFTVKEEIPSKKGHVKINYGDYVAISTQKKMFGQGAIQNVTLLYQVLSCETLAKTFELNVQGHDYEVAYCSLALTKVTGLEGGVYENFDDEYITKERVKMFRNLTKEEGFKIFEKHIDN